MRSKDGGVCFSADGTLGQYDIGFLISSMVIDNYDYLSFTLSNDSDDAVTIYFNGASTVASVPAHSTQEIQLDA